MEDSKVAPFGILSGLIVSIGIILLSQHYLGTNPGFAWLFKPFLWVFVPISLFAILAGAIVAALITVRKAIIDTCNAVGFVTGAYTCYAFIYKEVNVKNIILSLIVSFMVYTFFAYIVAAFAGAFKYRNETE